MAGIGVGIVGLLVTGILCGHIGTGNGKSIWYGIGGYVPSFVYIVAIAGICLYGMVGAFNAGKYSNATYYCQQA